MKTKFSQLPEMFLHDLVLDINLKVAVILNAIVVTFLYGCIVLSLKCVPLYSRGLVLPIWKIGYIFNSLLIQKFLFYSYFFSLSYLLNNKGYLTCRGCWSGFSWLNINDVVQHISVWSTHGHLDLEPFSNSDSMLLANAEVVFYSSIRRNLIFGCLLWHHSFCYLLSQSTY